MGQIRKETVTSCWNCEYQQKGGINLFGNCIYFESIGKDKKEIPSSIVDKGCKFFKSKTEKHPLYDLAVEMFNGVEIK